jgi:hypothetical protein
MTKQSKKHAEDRFKSSKDVSQYIQGKIDQFLDMKTQDSDILAVI